MLWRWMQQAERKAVCIYWPTSSLETSNFQFSDEHFCLGIPTTLNAHIDSHTLRTVMWRNSLHSLNPSCQLLIVDVCTSHVLMGSLSRTCYQSTLMECRYVHDPYAACLHRDLRSYGLESVRFGDIQVVSLLFPDYLVLRIMKISTTESETIILS